MYQRTPSDDDFALNHEGLFFFKAAMSLQDEKNYDIIPSTDEAVAINGLRSAIVTKTPEPGGTIQFCNGAVGKLLPSTDQTCLTVAALDGILDTFEARMFGIGSGNRNRGGMKML